MGVKYAMFNSEGVTIEWQDEQGETQETKLSWARAAGVVQRLVDEGRYLETPVVSLPEPETDEPLEGETEPYDYSFEYGLLGRLKADCEYFLSEGHQHEKHLWAGSVHAQIAKMRELYDLLPEKPEGITKEIIDDYETRMAPWEHDEAEETQILDEALDAHHGQIDMLMQAVRGELTVGTIRYSIFEGRPHISMIEVLEDYRRQGIATQMLRYLQGQYPNEEIVWGYLTEDGSALYQAVVDEQPNPDYLRVQNDLEDITREFDAYVRRLDGGAILSPQEAADMDDLEDTQYRLEKSWKNCAPFAPLYEWAMVQQQRRPLLWMKPPPLIWRPFVSRLRRRRSPHTTSVFLRTMTCIQVEQKPNIKTMSWQSSCSSRLSWKSGQRHRKNKSSLPVMSDGAGLPMLSPVRPLVGRTNIRN